MNTFNALRRTAITTWPVLFLLSSCQKNEMKDLDAELTLRYDHIDFTVPPNTQAGTLDIALDFHAQQDITELLQQHGFSMDNLKEVHLLDARAVIVEPVNTHFDAMENMSFSFSRPIGPMLTVARITPIPDGLGILDLTVDSGDLTSFFRTNDGSWHVGAEVSAPIDQGTRLRFALTFRVKAAK